MPKTRLRGHPLESLVDGEDGGVLLLVGVALVAQPALEVVEARVQRGHVALRLLCEALDALRFLEREEGDELLLDARVHVVLLPGEVVRVLLEQVEVEEDVELGVVLVGAVLGEVDAERLKVCARRARRWEGARNGAVEERPEGGSSGRGVAGETREARAPSRLMLHTKQTFSMSSLILSDSARISEKVSMMIPETMAGMTEITKKLYRKLKRKPATGARPSGEAKRSSSNEGAWQEAQRGRRVGGRERAGVGGGGGFQLPPPLPAVLLSAGAPRASRSRGASPRSRGASARPCGRRDCSGRGTLR